MRAIDKFIIHVTHNLFPLNEYSEGEINKLMTKFKEEADDLNIQITDAQLKAYIERFDSLKNSPKVTEKDLRKYNLSKLIKLVTASKGVEEPEEEVDITPDVVYNQNGLIIYNGSKEENCLTFGRGESWCITRGSFGNYRYDDGRKNPTFYLVKDTNLPDSDRKSFFVIVVGNDNTYKASDRSNNDVGGRATEWNRWEGWSFIEQNFPSIVGLRSVFKYIPLSTKEKMNQTYKHRAVSIREWAKFPFQAKEQYLVVRKGRGDIFSDITNDEFIAKYLPKYPQIANTIATNAGIIDSVTLVKNLDKFSNQDTRSIIANMRDKISLKFLSTENISFEIKKFLVKFDKWEVPKNERLYVTKDEQGIVQLTLGENIKVGLYTEDDDYPNIKLNKRTSRYLLDYPELDKIPFKNLMTLVSDGVIDKSVLNSVIETARTDSNSAIIAKDIDNKTILIDSNSFASYKIDGDRVSKVPFDDEDVQAVFAQQKDNEGFQKNALTLINYDDSIPETIDKDAFIALLKAIPQNKRVIEWRSRPAVIIMTNSENHPFFVQDLERGVSSFQITALYGYGGDWRRKTQGSNAEDKEVYSAWFEYLRSRNIAFGDDEYIRALRNIGSYGGRLARTAIIGANPPMQTNSRLKSIIYNDVPYIINTVSPRTSFTVSSTSGKLVVANISASQAAQMLGTAAPAVAATGRRGRPAGGGTPRAQQPAATAAGDIDISTEMGDIGLDVAFARLPRPILRRLNVNNASRVDPNGDRGAARRNNLLGTAGRVGRVISLPSGSKIYIIRLANQQIIASINVQPGNSNYILTGNASGNNAFALNSPAELLSVLQQRGLAEAHQYIMNEYLENYPGHIKEFKDLLRKHINEKNANK